MTTKAELDQLKVALKEARKTAMHAHKSWALFNRSYGDLLKGFASLGVKFPDAQKELKKITEAHHKQYKDALEFLANLEAKHKRLAAQLNKGKNK